MESLLIYLTVGAGAGLLAGLLGVGGGIIVVPALVFTFEHLQFPDGVVMHLAVGTSLATIVVTALASIRAHHKRGAVNWRVVGQLTPGIVIGAVIGAGVADILSGNTLRLCFGLFAMLLGLNLVLTTQPKPHRNLPGTPGQTVAGLIIGSISALVGIGGGSMSVPYMIWHNVDVRRAVATSAACGFPIAVAGALGFVVTGWNDLLLPAGSSGYVYWPAAFGMGLSSILVAGLGAKIAHTIPPLVLRRLFGVLLISLGTRMVWG